jgi:hypothetical protein
LEKSINSLKSIPEKYFTLELATAILDKNWGFFEYFPDKVKNNISVKTAYNKKVEDEFNYFKTELSIYKKEPRAFINKIY